MLGIEYNTNDTQRIGGYIEHGPTCFGPYTL